MKNKLPSLIQLLSLVLLTSCSYFVMGDSLLEIRTEVTGIESNQKFEIILLNNKGKELYRSNADRKGSILSSTFVVAPYDEEYSITISDKNGSIIYESDIFITNGPITKIELGPINI